MKTILVTGASSGIGEAVAKYLAEQGHQVVCVARNKDRLNRVCEYASDRMWNISYDLSELYGIGQIFEQIKEKTGLLDGMVHCAGINRDMPVRVNGLDEMEQVMNINCNAFIELGKYYSMKKYSVDAGSIVAISSTASLTCEKGMCTYAVSKAGLNAAVKVMSKEFMKRKIRVNAILPNFVNTAMARESIAYIGGIGEEIQPLGIIEPEYIAYLVDFLLSEKAKYMTGSLIPVTAGAVLGV